MGTKSTAPEAQEKRFATYMDVLAKAAGHADRAVPLKASCAGLLLPGERKSVEPMAARLAPDDVRRMHQSLHHVVAGAPWSDQLILGQVRASGNESAWARLPACADLHRWPRLRADKD